MNKELLHRQEVRNRAMDLATGTIVRVRADIVVLLRACANAIDQGSASTDDEIKFALQTVGREIRKRKISKLAIFLEKNKVVKELAQHANIAYGHWANKIEQADRARGFAGACDALAQQIDDLPGQIFEPGEF